MFIVTCEGCDEPFATVSLDITRCADCETDASSVRASIITDLMNNRVSWDEYYPGNVCHFSGHVRGVVTDDDGSVSLLVEVVDSVGVARLKFVAADVVKLATTKSALLSEAIIDQIGRMGIVATGEMRDAVERVIEHYRVHTARP